MNKDAVGFLVNGKSWKHPYRHEEKKASLQATPSFCLNKHFVLNKAFYFWQDIKIYSRLVIS